MFDRERLTEIDERTMERFLGVNDPPLFVDAGDHFLAIEDGKLRANGVSIAWYDTAGAVWIHLPSALWMYDSAHYLSALAQRLGLPALERTSFEPSSIETTGSAARWPTVAWTLGDEVIKLGEPFLLCGPMGVQAYRAARMVK